MFETAKDRLKKKFVGWDLKYTTIDDLALRSVKLFRSANLTTPKELEDFAELTVKVLQDTYTEGYWEGLDDGYEECRKKNLELRGDVMDIVHIVRCKNCLHREGSVCSFSSVHVHPDGYCNWGVERMDHDDEQRMGTRADTE